MAVWVVLFIYVTALISQNNALEDCTTGEDCEDDEDCLNVGTGGTGICHPVGEEGDLCNGNYTEDKTQIYDLFSTCGKGLYCDGNYSTESCKDNKGCLEDKVVRYNNESIRCQKNPFCKTGMDCQEDDDCIFLGNEEENFGENKIGKCYPKGEIDDTCNGNNDKDSDSQIYDIFSTCAKGLTCVGNYSTEPCTDDECLRDKVEYYVNQSIRCQNLSAVDDMPDQPNGALRECTTGQDCEMNEDCVNLGDHGYDENKKGICYLVGQEDDICNGNYTEDKTQIYDIFSTCRRGLYCDGNYSTEPCKDDKCMMDKVDYYENQNIICRKNTICTSGLNCAVDEDCITLGNSEYGENKSGMCYPVAKLGDYCSGEHNEDAALQIHDIYSTCEEGLYCNGTYTTEPCNDSECLKGKVDYSVKNDVRCVRL